MKALFPALTVSLLSLTSLGAFAAPGATLSGPWVQLRNAPVFEAKTQPLAANWGPALPIGQEFRVEKVYGRWLYGTPAPLARMPEKEYAKPGWVFSRMLLLGGDEDTLPAATVRASRAVIFHTIQAAKKIPMQHAPLDFLESLTLSKGTLKAFSSQDEKALTSWRWPSFVPAAHAEGEIPEAPPSMGLSGTDLNFLDQEFSVIQEKKNAEKKLQQSKKLRPPPTPAIDQGIRTAILGRYMLQKYLELPTLTHEEVDGFIYMRATAMRALDGCPKIVRNFWANRRWNHYRAFRLKSRPEIAHPWLEVALPGGYFAFSGKSLDLAGNESEMAFLLVRPLVRELRLQRKKPKFSAKTWPQDLETESEEIWDQTLKSQSTKYSVNLDVADENAVDIMATECISRSGYRPMGGISYLRKIAAKREEPWAQWFTKNSIGLDYRIERLASVLETALAEKKFPEGQATNPKRFATASRHWNILP